MKVFLPTIFKKQHTHIEALHWKYYCLIGETGRRVLEWELTEPRTVKKVHGSDDLMINKYGYLKRSIVEKQCISAGLTFAFVSHYYYERKESSFDLIMSQEPQQTNFPTYMHYPKHAELWNDVRRGSFGFCGQKTFSPFSDKNNKYRGYSKCILSGFGSSNLKNIYAIRARTPTSTGMNRIEVTPRWNWRRVITDWMFDQYNTHTKHNVDQEQEKYWSEIESTFGITNITDVSSTKDFIQQNLVNIVQDAIVGHCKPDLTCKKESLHKLESILKLKQNDKT